MLKKNKVYKKNPNIVERKIEDEVVLVPIKKDAADMEAIYNLDNQVSVRIWELIDGKTNLDKIKDKILEDFEVKQENLGKDLEEFFGDLENIGAIK